MDQPAGAAPEQDGGRAELTAEELPGARAGKSRWVRYAARIISFAMLVAIILQLRNAGTEKLSALLPETALFWIALAAMYMLQPLIEFGIYRKLWGMPLAGLPAVMRKRISSDVLMGYSGEVYLYAWARERPHIVKKPFGAVKDVSILSAVSGNVVTLAMLVLVYFHSGAELLERLGLGQMANIVIASLAFLIAIPLAAFFLRGRIFTLDRRTLAFVLAMHILRIVGTTLLIALVWHLALPELPLSTWLVLATMRLLISRLPLIPNKEILFAVATALIVGGASLVDELVAMTAALIFLIHLLLGLALAFAGMFERPRRAPAP
ncbi:MAG: hypothetical protein ACFBQW_08500 [Sphingomonadaceae bacterium]